MSRRRRQTFEDRYSPEYLAKLDAMTCAHDEPRGARYCPLCRRLLARLSSGRRLDEAGAL